MLSNTAQCKMVFETHAMRERRECLNIIARLDDLAYCIQRSDHSTTTLTLRSHRDSSAASVLPLILPKQPPRFPTEPRLPPSAPSLAPPTDKCRIHHTADHILHRS